MENLDNENKYIKAKDKVKKIKKFYNSLISYVVFIGFLAGLNYYIGGWRHPWFLWLAIAWGVGLVYQARKAFDWNPFVNRNWERRKIQEFMNEDNKEYKKTQHWE